MKTQPTFIIFLCEGKVEKVGVSRVAVKDPMAQSGVVVSVLVPHVDVAVLQSGALLGVLVTLQFVGEVNGSCGLTQII